MFPAIYFRIFGYTVTIIMHVVNTIYMFCGLRGEILDHPVIKRFGSMQIRYFTCWTFFLQVSYAIMGLYCDIQILKNKHIKDFRLPKRLKGIRDTLFAGVIWPSTWLVCIFFWSVFNYDRNLILPPIIDQVLTKTSNHVIHTAIIPVVVWEAIFQPRVVPRSHFNNLFYTTVHHLIYFAVLLYSYFERGFWMYPIFEHFYASGLIYFSLLIIAIGVAVYFFYHLQWVITKMVWGDLNLEKNKRKIR